MNRSLLILLVAAVLGAGCNLFNSSTSPSGGSTTEVFANSVGPSASSLYTFTVGQTGTVTLDLTALSVAGPVGLGIGTPNGTTSCSLTSSTPSAAAATTPQISATETAGSYCAEVFDVGKLTAAANFSVTIVHP